MIYLREEEFDGAIARSKGVCVIPLGCSGNIGRAMAHLLVERLVKMFRTLKEDDSLMDFVEERFEARS